MKFASEASVRVLEQAQKRETESRDFYRDCLGKATIAGTQEILKNLVADEERHYDIVTAMLEEAKSSGKAASIDTKTPVDAKNVLEKAFPHAMTAGADFSAEAATVGQMLKTALANEKESYDNYAGAARDADEPELREIYEFLANEENRHYILVSNLAEYLADPGEWLYQEENLIFRRG